MTKRASISIAVLTVLSLFTFISSNAYSKDDEELVSAITYLKELDPVSIPVEKQKEAAEKIESSWKTISSYGKKGTISLKEAVDSSQNDFFRLNACVLLWNTGNADEAEYIAGVWADTDLTANDSYVFFTAVDAASTGDPRVAPMLRAVLRDHEGKTYFSMHAMEVPWPLTHEFIWGVYGSNGVAELVDVLNTSTDKTELESVLILLPKFLPMDSLEKIRELAMNGKDDVKDAAVHALGFYGHPNDFDTLINGLNSSTEKERIAYVYALYEYEDLRAVSHLIPLLESSDQDLLRETLSALSYLLTPEGFDAIMDCSESSKHKLCSTAAEALLKYLEITAEEYRKLDNGKKQKLCDRFHEKLLSRYYLREDDRKINRKEFLKIVKEMKKANRITLKKYEWVEDRHFLSVATPDDIDLIADLRASLYLRMSDEALYETRVLDGLIKKLRRKGYRENFGITGNK